jgi:ferritin
MKAPAPAVVTALEQQLNHELKAAQDYLALALWCEVRDWDGFARFFRKQAGEEREHADKFLNHLTDRGVLPALGTLPAPKRDYTGLLEVARLAHGLECANTAGIQAAYEVALQEKDYPAQVLLQWFINEQVEEEAWSSKMVAKVERASCGGGAFYLDHHLEKEILGGGD